MKTKGYIYAITSPRTDKCYIGSTTKPIYKRLKEHTANYKFYKKRKEGEYPPRGNYCASYEVIKYETYDIELLDTIKYKDKQLLRDKEQEYINMFDTYNLRLKVFSGLL